MVADPMKTVEAGLDGAPHKVTGQGRIPGDLTREQLLERLVRVDHAGEYGAVRIYSGQLAVLGKGPKKAMLNHMLEQEVVHKEYFEKAIAARQGRPTVLQPVWHVAGWALGAGTALLGERAAMACTVAVEEAIDEHYAEQAEMLGDDEAELKETILKFRQEELEHRDIGYEHGAEQAPAYPLLYGAIKKGTKLAIWLSERI
jgi:ubiquinone biosynthesis monooxygenase Coq7